MLKPISKIAIVLFITFLSGLVMTDSVLPELQNEERAEIEIEEEEEVEISNLIQAELVTSSEKGDGEDKIVSVQSIFEISDKSQRIIYSHQIEVVESIFAKQSINTPLYILYCELKLNL